MVLTYDLINTESAIYIIQVPVQTRKASMHIAYSLFIRYVVCYTLIILGFTVSIYY